MIKEGGDLSGSGLQACVAGLYTEIHCSRGHSFFRCCGCSPEWLAQKSNRH